MTAKLVSHETMQKKVEEDISRILGRWFWIDLFEIGVWVALIFLFTVVGVFRDTVVSVAGLILLGGSFYFDVSTNSAIWIRMLGASEGEDTELIYDN